MEEEAEAFTAGVVMDVLPEVEGGIAEVGKEVVVEVVEEEVLEEEEKEEKVKATVVLDQVVATNSKIKVNRQTAKAVTNAPSA